jgi:resuscitation-promoting factor RpfB
MNLRSNILLFVHKHAFASGIFTVIFAFFFFSLSLVAANGQTVGPTDSRVVSLYIDNKESTVPTRADTVGQFVKNAGLNIKDHDLVEPSLDSKITEDDFKINVYRARPIVIVDGQSKTYVLSPQTSPRLIAHQAGLQTFPEDNLTLTTVNNFASEQSVGEILTIDRATPITFSLYGAPAVTYRTRAKTVGEFLATQNIVPEPNATLLPVASTALSPDLPVFISKFGKKTVSDTQTIPFETQTTNDPNQPVGKITVVTAGKLGKKQVSYELDLRDNKETGRRLIQEVVIDEPVNQVQTKGTKFNQVSGDKQDWMRAAGIPEDQFGAVDYIIGRESGWRPGALNAGGCAGLGQACPASKLARACPDWQTNPVCQLQFFGGYAGRYGGWQGAYNFWIVNHWW